MIQLMAQERDDPRWMTYNQAKDTGAQVRRGEHGTQVQYWKFTEQQDKTDENGKPVLDKEGQPVKEEVRLERPKVFSATVFNASQIDGLPPLQRKEQAWDANERAEGILNASGADIRHGGQDKAFYRPSSDSIHLPDKAQFPEASGYYATALHELGHWTGHPSRLDRDLSHPFGSEGYAKEELRAEIASMIVGDDLGIGHDPSQHAAYVGSWIKALQDDPMEVFRAASDAEKIHGYLQTLEQKQVQAQANPQAVRQEQQPVDVSHLETGLELVAEREQAVRRDPASTAEDLAAANEEMREAVDNAIQNATDSQRRDTGPAIQERQQASQVQQEVETDKTFLNVPYREKEEAKALGAKWDRQEQAWFVPPGVDVVPFAKWANTMEATSQASTTKNERQYLAVPFADRQAAKDNGALWDTAAKSWYVGQKADMEQLKRWLPENVPAQQGPPMSPMDEFADALRSIGCEVSGQHPIMDGKKHRITAEGDKKGEQAGFYVGHLDGHPAGYMKNNRTGAELRWKSKGYSLDPEQKAKLQAEAAEKLQARAAEQDRLHKEAAQRVRGQIANLHPITEPTPYLQAKGIEPATGALTDRQGQTTFIPATDATGKVQSMQYIQADGTKRFAKDSAKEGCFHVVGGFDALAKAPALAIGEGYATAASLSKALGFATVAAFDSGNLPAVAKALHEKFPDKPIVIFGDDDQHLMQTEGVNPGRKKAEEAAQSVGGQAVFPVFAPGEQSGEPKGFTDFNDLANKSSLGSDGLERQAKYALSSAIEERQTAVIAQKQEKQLAQGQEIQQQEGGRRHVLRH